MRLAYRKILLLAVVAVVCSGLTADDFVDDVYYLPDVELQKKLNSGNTELTPHYNKNVREIIFLTDTTAANMPLDTVKAIIRDVPDKK